MEITEKQRAELQDLCDRIYANTLCYWSVESLLDVIAPRPKFDMVKMSKALGEAVKKVKVTPVLNQYTQFGTLYQFKRERAINEIIATSVIGA